MAKKHPDGMQFMSDKEAYVVFRKMLRGWTKVKDVKKKKKLT